MGIQGRDMLSVLGVGEGMMSASSVLFLASVVLLCVILYFVARYKFDRVGSVELHRTLLGKGPASASDRFVHRYSGLLLMVLTIVGIEVVSRRYFRVPDAAVFLLLVVAYTGFTGGLGRGLVSAVLALLYCSYFFTIPEEQSAENMILLALLALVMPAIGAAVGLLRHRTDWMGEQLLRRQVAFSSSLMGSMQEGLLLCEGGTVRDVNASFCRMTGYTAQELVGMNPPYVFWAQEEKAKHQGYGEASCGAAFEQEFERKNGEKFTVLVSASKLEGDGARGECLVLVRDVTERKKAEEELRKAKELAEASNRTKDQFLAILSHELRTPLTPVLATVTALERESDLPEPVRGSLQMLRRNVELEARLIDDLLDLTRISKGKLQLEFETVDAHAAIVHAVEICRNDILTKRLVVTTELRAEAFGVRADAARLEQIYWNLIKNAIKFTPVGGWIAIRTMNHAGARGDADLLVMEVVDSGIGIDAQVLPKIFDAFEQGEMSVTRTFGGLGLGLAITKALVEAQGGHVTARSGGRNQGSTFTVVLPVAAAGGNGKGPRPAGQAGAPARSMDILLVEDHADTAAVMRRLLEGQGHRVTHASTVEEGVAAGGRGGFDLLISDIGLPDGSGLELLGRLKGVRPRRAIALSGFGMEDDLKRSVEAGFDEHLTKPVNFQKLDEAIRRMAE